MNTVTRKHPGRAAPLLALAGLSLLQLAAPRAALAATACVADTAGLTSAMTFLSKNSEVATINLEENTYQLGALDISFPAPIQFVGGFKPGTLCATHEDNASKTIVDFGGAANNVWFTQSRGSPSGALSFSDLTLRNGGELQLFSGDYSDPPFLGQHYHAGRLGLNHVRITNFGWVRLGIFYGVASITDVLFDHIHAGSTCAITTSPFDTSTYILDHVTMDLSNGHDLCLGDSDKGSWNYTFANSIIWASDGTLSAVRGLNEDNTGANTNATFDHTLFKGFVGTGATTIKNQTSSDPLWVNPASGDYHLKYPPQSLSPAVNAGADVPGASEPFTDIEGATRTIGSKTDLGAYESPFSDASEFTVSNATDCSAAGCGSLRDALNLAHNSAAPSATIKFAIPGGCPAVISLAAVLPDVDKPVTIDGYTQPLSSVNNDPAAFNANLCVVVEAASGASVFYGLRVPAGSNGQLTLRGVGFGGLGVGVLLFGGTNHQIVGNQFGGYMDNGSHYLDYLLIAGVYMDSSDGQISIGGYDSASRNAFLHVASNGGPPASAIEIGADANGAQGACQIVGNTIGLESDGTFLSRNVDYGVYVLGSNCYIGSNRIAGMNHDAIFLDGGQGGQNNVVQNNTLGLAAYGFDLSTLNLGAGVRSTGVHNVIGASTSNGGTAAFGNLIRYMDAGGVVITGQNAYGNTIRGNSIQDNGPAGDGMSIDLGGDGPTINDICDCDTGPNDNQNFPTLHSLAWSSPPNAQTHDANAVVSGTLRTFPGQYFQVDVYYALGCDSAGKGIAAQWIGSNDFIGLPAQTYMVPFSAQVQIPEYAPAKGGALSVTATNNINGEGSTSEVSTCFPIDTIFRDGHDGGYGFD